MNDLHSTALPRTHRTQHLNANHHSMVRTRLADSFDLPVDIQVDLPYISELDFSLLGDASTLVVKSPIATGKTRLSTRLIRQLLEKLGRPPRVLVITHRQSLADDLTNRLNDDLADLLFECYKGLSDVQIRQVDRLVICLNSLHKLIPLRRVIPRFDLIVIDEVEQVLGHLGGGTFREGQAANTYILLRQMVRSAEQVVVMDADASGITYDWLQKLDRKVTTVVNTYVPDRGPLYLYNKHARLVATAERIAEENNGVVVIPTNSHKEAKRLRKYFEGRFGKHAVFMISSDNSDSDEAQAFLKHINTELPNRRIFIYTPSLGTGVDIQCTVRAVCAVFHSQPLAATELHQMIGRCRSRQETHVFVSQKPETEETDAHAIYNRHLQNAVQTGRQCDITEHGVLDVTPSQKELLWLQSRLQAVSNRSINELYSHFQALAAGYAIESVTGSNRQVAHDLRKVQASLDAQTKERVLIAEPVDDETYNQARGKLEEAMIDGHKRFVIEDCTGSPLTRDLYDAFESEQSRRALTLFTDLYDDREALRLHDQKQAEMDVLLQQRDHRTMQRRLIEEMLITVFGERWESADTVLSAEDVQARMASYLGKYGRDALRYFEHRKDRSDGPIPILRWLLGKVGLKLSAHQVRVSGQHRQEYRLDRDTLTKMHGYAQTRLTHLETKRGRT